MSTVVISVDAGLGWGYHDHEDPPEERLSAARAGWGTLLELFQEFDVPATWGIVGHCMLEDCEGVHVSHPLGPGWFDCEREQWADRPELRFGRDLVAATMESSVEHDVGFRTFSHVEFGDEAVSPELARAECAAFFDAADGLLSTPGSAIFPGNAVGHRDVLAEWGFDCYRGVPPQDDGVRGVGKRIGRLLQRTVSSPPVVTPTVDEFGLVNVPGSMDLFESRRASSLYERVFGDPVVRRARRGIDRVARTDEGVFHMWLEPNQLVSETDVERVRSVLSCVESARTDGVEVATMAEVAEAYSPTTAVELTDVAP